MRFIIFGSSVFNTRSSTLERAVIMLIPPTSADVNNTNNVSVRMIFRLIDDCFMRGLLLERILVNTLYDIGKDTISMIKIEVNR